MTRINTQQRRRRGFTMVELLMVIAVVTLLMSISYVALANSMTLARQKATAATILKIHGLVQQRVEAFNRAIDRANLQPAASNLKKKLDLPFGYTITPKAYQILVRKQIFQSRFPQNFYESNTLTTVVGYVSSNHQQVTESSALLYWILTKSEIYGVAPVDESEFSSSEVRDTDGDGLMEFVDAWGHPLRFYRWPTHLFRPGTSAIAPGVPSASLPLTLTAIDRTYVNVLWSGLPAPPTVTGALDPLSLDPDDPTGELRRNIVNAANPVEFLTLLQNRFHTPDTYHSFLIMSAGLDNVLGVMEPYDYGGIYDPQSRLPTAPNPDGGYPAVTWPLTTTTPPLGGVTSPPSGTVSVGQGRLASLIDHTTVENNPINDNITNRQR